MKFNKAALSVAMLLLAFCRSVLAFDVVTMKNGDIHNGTVAQSHFGLRTMMGDVSIPYAYMSKIKWLAEQQIHQIITRQDEIYFGVLLEKEFSMLRTLDPLLPLTIADIEEVVFSGGLLSAKKITPGDAVISQSGDRFFAKIKISDLLLKTQTSIRLLPITEIALLDSAVLMDGDELLSQVTLTNGEVLQGQLSNPFLAVENAYGQLLNLPVKTLSAVAFAYQPSKSPSNFKFRARLGQKALIRDQIMEGRFAPQLIVVPAGEYIRGEASGDDDEKPPHKVKLAKFAIGIYEVTFDEYDFYCEQTRGDRPDDGGWGRGQRPVVNVSWNEATAYTQWLSEKTRKKYRLATDAEWEYIARAGSQTRFWWGDEILMAKANCEGCGSLWGGDKTAPVGRFPANAFGLHDTAGNVFEWVADCYHNSLTKAPRDGSAWDKPGCGKRVIRGGAWSFPVKEVRSANRWRDFPSRRSDDTGFRVVREMP